MANSKIKKKNILVTGGNGQLGKAYGFEKKNKLFNIIVLSKSELNICNIREVESKIIKFKPDIIINSAAYTNVEKSEKKFKLAQKVNFYGVKNLVKICKKNKIILLHFSTDYIFFGNSKFDYKESNLAIPKNNYGISKLNGEKYIKNNLKKYLIIRLSWVFGYGKNNFVYKILNKAKKEKKLSVTDNEFSSPTSASDVVNITLKMLKEIVYGNNKSYGIYHYNSFNKKISRFQFAKIIINLAKKSEFSKIKIAKVLNNDKIRPLNSFLNTKKIYNKFNFKKPKFKNSLNSMIKYYLRKI